ncbi:complement resistance protein TraT [Vibrio furnissii]|uniref:complement resistance protein TraT n=1 Tax=Vibrio furnissii TaxID=29494 RepID=UPI001C9CCEA3|nr:complement resistance protein TraT [Vibrio furnissii]MBY7933066.1 complement resistance protein TraT [Vibrio fluvialis]MCG6230276.1 complement resistance protein TraT [Vibrio furnissii]MCG6268475.1 complement resistance protein TraT [Vibrio furnissii]
MKNTKKKLVVVALASALALSGCSAVSTAVNKRNLDVKTQMSETVWLDPVSQEQKTVFLQVRNTSDQQINVEDALKGQLEQKGYTVTDNPALAHYWIQTNILKLDKMDLREAQGFLSSGYGAGLTGGALTALAVAANTSHTQTIIGAGLVGVAAGFIADSLVEDVNYAMITDIQIVEKTEQQVKTTETANIKNGSSANTATTLTTLENKKRYQTRVMSTANKVNLDFEEAKPALIDGLASSISGVF